MREEFFESHIASEGIKYIPNSSKSTENVKISDGGVSILPYEEDSSKIDIRIVESYCSEIEEFLDSNDFGAIKPDLESLNEHYHKKKHVQCNGYLAQDVEKLFAYNYGAAISKACYEESSEHIGEPDVEGIIRDMLELHDTWYFEKDTTYSLMKGAEDWKRSSYPQL